MLHQVIVDTGVLVALIDRRDRYHTWVTEQLTQIAPPLLDRPIPLLIPQSGV
ncbi:hypothetical protein [Nostoc sp. NMS4]|uniref:hypothetical protein n=1 Tax=Nostoc sp. NMS4 TaxID=2815390 RepID=UPI0025E39FE3|nr:hypothetical protein [Nostoc sp. NMS4]MBN3924494.1 PIN domain nuclease [Nostoc sp. NMS4]